MPAITFIPPTVIFLPAVPPPVTLGMIPPPSIAGSPYILIYSGNNPPGTSGSAFYGDSNFPTLPPDTMLEVGLFHGGNPLITTPFQIPAYDQLAINVSENDIYSTEKENGIFDITYPLSGLADGKIQYTWDDVYTSPLGIYTHTSLGSVSPSTPWNFNITNEVMTILTNDVNVIPRVTDYIVFNMAPNLPATYTYVNGSQPAQLPYFKGTETHVARITNVTYVSGTGVAALYTISLDKSFNFTDFIPILSSPAFSIVLLNRDDTSIQKELFYDTFEQIEIQRQQLLGDPYNNLTDTSVPYGRMNFLNYNGVNSLGMQQLLNGIINGNNTPFIIFDLNDDIQDRISPKGNAYDVNNNPIDVNFEFHLPYAMINDNVYPATLPLVPVDVLGNVLENIFVVNSNPTSIIIDPNIGRYNGMYLKQDTGFTKRYGWVFFDLRIIVVDHAELATALGYNSNRNYTLPDPNFVPASGNNIVNVGVGIDLQITGASNTSPLQITVNSPYGLPNGTRVFISGVYGNTVANGDYFITALYPTPNPYKFNLWTVPPTYVSGVPTGGVPVDGTSSGVFVNNGPGNSGFVLGGVPPYSYFYTYRIRTSEYSTLPLEYNATMPYANAVPFNWASGGFVNNTSGQLNVTIPPLIWHNSQAYLTAYGLGFGTLGSGDGFGIDVIIGQYQTNPLDPVNPTAIIGIQNVMCIPLSSLTTPVDFATNNPVNGITFLVDKISDYNAAVTSSATTGMTNYTYDVYNNLPLYFYSFASLPPTLLTGNGLWTLGNFIYRNHVLINRAVLSINVPANAWNDSTNPSYNPSTNSFITNKYISEVAIILNEDSIGNEDLEPMIYAKISPAIVKSNDLDLQVDISVDF